jgi:hypothetical protein
MTRNSNRVAVAGAMLLAMVLGWTAPVVAQNPTEGAEKQTGPDPAELARQIRRNIRSGAT